MASVVLVDPPGWQGAAQGHIAYPNVGIAYLAAALVQAGHEVRVLDCNNEPRDEDDLLALVSRERPTVVGFSVKTATLGGARRLGKALKKAHPEIVVVLGGPHATLTSNAVLAEEPWIDLVFVGEGEDTFPELVSRLKAGAGLAGLAGVLSREAGADVSPAKATLRDVEGLAFPDYSSFPPVVLESIAESYPLVTSRGCSYKCTFCSVPAISGKRLRRQTPERVLDELRWARERWGSRGFEIIDDLFNLDMRRCKAICRSLIEADLGLPWSCPNGLRADRVDQELAELMAAAGCHRVMVGIESADPEVLASVNKGETLEEVEQGIRIFQAAGITVGGFFIVGLPGDSYASEELSVKFAERLGISAHFGMLIPYPGTALHEWSKAEARLLRSPEEGVHFADEAELRQSVLETEDFSAAERERAYEMVNTRLRHFNMLIPKGLGRWARFRESLRLVWKHDRSRFVPYLLGRVLGALGQRLRRLLPAAQQVRSHER